MDQTESFIEPAPVNLIIIVGTGIKFQMVETLDFASNLGYILPGSRKIDPVKLANGV
ncbi:hypothetical protein okayama3_12020 [Yersinia pseudotuberculosis]